MRKSMNSLRIYKYRIPYPAGQPTIQMPAGAKILRIGLQSGTLYLWALVDTTAPIVNRFLVIYGTGWEVPEQDLGEYLGTFEMSAGLLVWHLFDGPEVPLSEDGKRTKKS